MESFSKMPVIKFLYFFIIFQNCFKSYIAYEIIPYFYFGYFFFFQKFVDLAHFLCTYIFNDHTYKLIAIIQKMNEIKKENIFSSQD